MATGSDDAYRDAPRTLGGTAKLEQPDEVKARIAQKRVTFSGGFNPATHTVGGRTAKLDKPPEVLEREAEALRTAAGASEADTTPRRFVVAIALLIAALTVVAAAIALI